MRVYLDRNDRLSASSYMTNLEKALRSSVPEVTVVETPTRADVLHLNNLNVWGRVVNGKESRGKHFGHWLRGLAGNTPLVVTAHGDVHFTPARRLVRDREVVSRFVRLSQRLLSRYVDGIITASRSVERNLARYGIGGGKTFVVPHGVEDRYRRGSDSSGQYLLHVSHYSHRKNPGAVFEVAEALDEQIVITGAGWEENAPEQLRDDDTVLFPGYVSEDRLIELYNDASVFYFPTLHEGFGLPVLEAMQAGLAVVTSDVYAVPEVVDDAAVLYAPNDTTAHRRAIEELLGDDDLRREYERKAANRAEEFSWTRTATETAAVYRTVVE
jgi:glycosyltransferase involved in cell wall biosynthesis